MINNKSKNSLVKFQKVLFKRLLINKRMGEKRISLTKKINRLSNNSIIHLTNFSNKISNRL